MNYIKMGFGLGFGWVWGKATARVVADTGVEALRKPVIQIGQKVEKDHPKWYKYVKPTVEYYKNDGDESEPEPQAIGFKID